MLTFGHPASGEDATSIRQIQSQKQQLQPTDSAMFSDEKVEDKAPPSQFNAPQTHNQAENIGDHSSLQKIAQVSFISTYSDRSIYYLAIQMISDFS